MLEASSLNCKKCNKYRYLVHGGVDSFFNELLVSKFIWFESFDHEMDMIQDFSDYICHGINITID